MTISKVVIGGALFLLTLISTSCASKVQERIVYRDVNVAIPISCVDTLPSKPLPNSNIVLQNLEILQYAKELELIVSHCVSIDLEGLYE